MQTFFYLTMVCICFLRIWHWLSMIEWMKFILVHLQHTMQKNKVKMEYEIINNDDWS